MNTLDEVAEYFPAVAEAVRMKRMYDGLKVGAATRPQYVFQGKDRDWYCKYHPNKRTKTIFTMAAPPGPLSNFMIVGGNPSTYFMRADGTAANKGAAGGPGSTASACMTPATHNGETFAAGDILALADDGGDFRDQITPPSSGSSGNPITYQPESGDSPLVNASELVTGWTLDSGNRWQASFIPVGPESTDVFLVFFDGTKGIDAGSQAAVDALNEWHYDAAADILYVFSTSDPDTAFTSPGIEANSHDFCFYVSSKSFITVDGVNLTKADIDCIKNDITSSDNIYQNLTLSFAANQGILSNSSANDTQLFSVTSHDNGITDQDHGFYFSGSGGGPWLMEDCISHNNVGIGFHLFDGIGGTVRRCLSYDNGSSGMIAQQLDSDQNITYEYCISRGNGRHGLTAVDLGVGGQNGNNDVKYHNCVSYNNGQYGIFIKGNNDADATVEFKNCISYENSTESSFYTDLEFRAAQSATFTLDNNCYFRASGDMIFWDGTDYLQTQFATYQSASGQDANGISSDPLFINAAGDDFHLKSNSPCIEAGVTVTLSQNRDFDNAPLGRGTNPDMGAHETLKGGPRGI